MPDMQTENSVPRAVDKMFRDLGEIHNAARGLAELGGPWAWFFGTTDHGLQETLMALQAGPPQDMAKPGPAMTLPDEQDDADDATVDTPPVDNHPDPVPVVGADDPAIPD